MASEVHSGDTQSAIEKLEEVLRQSYLRAERIMALLIRTAGDFGRNW